VTGGLEERKEVSMGGVEGRYTRGRRSLKRDVKKSGVEFGEELTLPGSCLGSPYDRQDCIQMTDERVYGCVNYRTIRRGH